MTNLNRLLVIKAKQLGRSRVHLVSEAFSVDPKTIRKGKAEQKPLPDILVKCIRKSSGGAKKLAIHPDWLGLFDKIIELKQSDFLKNKMLDGLT